MLPPPGLSGADPPSDPQNRAVCFYSKQEWAGGHQGQMSRSGLQGTEGLDCRGLGVGLPVKSLVGHRGGITVACQPESGL